MGETCNSCGMPLVWVTRTEQEGLHGKRKLVQFLVCPNKTCKKYGH